MLLLPVFIALVLLYGLISKLVERTFLTAPIIFTVCGVVVLLLVPELRDRNVAEQNIFLHVAELGLVLLLFSDASGVRLAMLKTVRGLASRLLSVGMLLTIALGALGALLVFPGMSVWDAGILAAILAPTDAGLGQVIVTSPLVPLPVRNALNVEAGLNDGLSVPFLLFFIALAGASTGSTDERLVNFVVEQLGYGGLVGIAIGGLGGWLLGKATSRDWIATSWQQLAVVSLPLLCLLASETVGASMFIAAFVAGISVQLGFKDASKHSVAFTEEWGQLFNLSVFFLFGILFARAWDQFTIMHALYAVCSLTVIRMLPVFIALLGTRLQRSTVLFMGWFGPRGLASIVLGLVYLEQQVQVPANSTIRLTVMMTVFISIIVHGLTAKPGAKLYAKSILTLGKDAPEYGA
ncbi:MAG: cation:proton antiporter [Candidatus Kapabacteria bacterium]|nr:cation:proton antiporter [Candidatus Kapabacteria bacterium]